MIISQRANKLIGTPSPLVSAHFEAEADAFDSKLNPNGAINLGTAENHLMDEESRQRISQLIPKCDYHLHYAEFRGIKSLRIELARFLETASCIRNISPDQIVIGNGVSSLLESLAYTLFDPGDGILIPSPCYSGYHDDFSARMNVKVITAPMDATQKFKLDIERLENSYEQASRSGEKIKAILVNNPNNPLGHIYSESVLKSLVEFAKQKELQIISDEIYAHSFIGGQKTKSLLEIGRDYSPNIHMLYGLAKDFGLSGFKFGLVVSQNDRLLKALATNAYFYNVSTYTQALVEQLLKDQSGTHAFLNLYHQRLRFALQHFETCNQSSINVEYIQPQGGHFVFLYLGGFLKAITYEEEMRLFEKIWNEVRVNVTPGQFFSCPEPGWFRLCFANQPELISEAFQRLQKHLSKV